MISRGELRPLRHPRFRAFLLARTTSLLGSAAAPIAVTFAVLDLTHSATALGIVLASRTIPMVGLLLFGGVLADRVRRDRVLVLSNTLCFLTQGSAAGLLLTGHAQIWQLATIEALNGAASAFTIPALQGILPQLVDRSELPQANALNGLVRNVTMIGGGAAGGALVGFAGTGVGLALDSWSYALSALLLSRLRLDDLPTGQGRSTVRDLAEGWREFVAHRWIPLIVGAFLILNAIGSGAGGTLGPLIADRTFGRIGWGALGTANAVGMLLGSLVMVRWRPRRPLVAGMIGVAGELPILVLLGLFPSLPALLVAESLAGSGMAVFGVAWDTTLQARVPADRLSRVSSYDALGSFVAAPLGQVTYGPLAAVFGVRPVVVGSAVVFGLVVAGTLVDQGVRLEARPARPEPAVR